MMSGVYEQDSNVTQLGNFTLETIQYRKNKTESSDVQIFKIMINPASNQAVISGRGRIWKNGQIPAGAGWYPVQPYYQQHTGTAPLTDPTLFSLSLF